MEKNSDTQRIRTDTEWNPFERMFDKSKSYIDDWFASINVKSTQSLDKFTSPDSEAKVFKRETEAANLKYKSNPKQLLFNACIINNSNLFSAISDLLYI